MRTSNNSRKLKRLKNKERINRLKNQLAEPSFILFLISLKLREQTTPEKLLARLRLHIEKLTGNIHIPGTTPTIIDLQTKADDLENAIDAVAAGNKALIPHRDNLVKEAVEMIRQLSYDVQFQSKGDKEKIKSTGFDVRKDKTPGQLPGQVLNLQTKTALGGRIKLRWKKEPNTAIYIIERLDTADPGSWHVAGKTQKTSHMFQGLTPGQLYTFRVYGTKGSDDGPPSDIAEQRSL